MVPAGEGGRSTATRPPAYRRKILPPLPHFRTNGPATASSWAVCISPSATKNQPVSSGSSRTRTGSVRKVWRARWWPLGAAASPTASMRSSRFWGWTCGSSGPGASTAGASWPRRGIARYAACCTTRRCRGGAALSGPVLPEVARAGDGRYRCLGGPEPQTRQGQLRLLRTDTRFIPVAPEIACVSTWDLSVRPARAVTTAGVPTFLQQSCCKYGGPHTDPCLRKYLAGFALSATPVPVCR